MAPVGHTGTQGGFAGNNLETSKQAAVKGRWELDIFGGNRRRVEAAEYRTQAAIAERDQTRRLLVAEVARNYIRLRGLQKQEALVRRNLKLQNDTLTITNEQRRESMVSQLDVLRARAQTGNTNARIPLIRADIHATINRLTVLVADRPGSMKKRLIEARPIPIIPRYVVVSMPLRVISRRPDVKMAEWELAETTALSGAALAEFFPKISLDALWGKSSSSIYGKYTPWSTAGSLIMPLLDFGRVKAGVDSADARQEQAFYNFQETVLLAVEDMEVNLANYMYELERRSLLTRVSDDQMQAVAIAREQYLAGIAPQLDLLDAERNALAAELEIVSSEVAAAQNIIQLYAALGENEAPSITSPAEVMPDLEDEVEGARMESVIDSYDKKEAYPSNKYIYPKKRR